MYNNTSFLSKLLSECHQLSVKPVILFAIYLLSTSLIISCNADADRSSKTAIKKQNHKKDISDGTKSRLTDVNGNAGENVKSLEVIDEKDIRFNGKLKRYFSLKEFWLVLGEPDSTKLLSDEKPCTNIFQEADGSVDPQAKYLYKNGSRFESSQDSLAIDEVKFANGDFLFSAT